jgi:tetratricopeptide (TPR) repeat protein
MASVPSPGGSYRLRDIRSLYPGIAEKHLQYLEKWGLLRQGTRPRDEREYSFADLTTIKQLATELERGTPLRAVLRGLSAERHGQRELDFHASGTPRAKVLTLQARRPAEPSSGAPASAGPIRDLGLPGFPLTDPQMALAAKYFVEASHLDDGGEATMGEAATAYRKALIVYPDLVPAIVNLANIHYAQDEMVEAQALYERAIGLDPRCFEAHFNLGNIHHDLGRFEDARTRYTQAVALNPEYPEAHFYLAVTLEKTGRSPEAKPHWRMYQELAPNGEWVELAREFTD